MAGDVAQMGRRRGSAAELVRWPWTGWCGAPPGSWAARIDDWWRCEVNQGVRGAQGSPAVRNREISTAALLTGVGVQCDSGRCSCRGRARRPGSCSWCQGEAPTRLWRGCSAAGRHGHCGAGERRLGGTAQVRWARVLAALVWMGCKGEARAPICRAAANLGVRARDGRPAKSRRGSRPGVAGGGGRIWQVGPGSQRQRGRASGARALRA